MFQDTQEMARDWASDRKIDVIPVVYSLMNRESSNGFLSGTVTRDTVFANNNLNKRYDRDEVNERVDYIGKLSYLIRDKVKNMAQAALRWVLDNPPVSLVLSGVKNANELQEAVVASSLQPFSEADHKRANEIHPHDFQAA